MVDAPRVGPWSDVLSDHLQREVRCSTPDRRVVAVRRANELQVQREKHRPRGGKRRQRDRPAPMPLGEACDADCDERRHGGQVALRERPGAVPERNGGVGDQSRDGHQPGHDQELTIARAPPEESYITDKTNHRDWGPDEETTVIRDEHLQRPERSEREHSRVVAASGQMSADGDRDDREQTPGRGGDCGQNRCLARSTKNDERRHQGDAGRSAEVPDRRRESEQETEGNQEPFIGEARSDVAEEYHEDRSEEKRVPCMGLSAGPGAVVEERHSERGSKRSKGGKRKVERAYEPRDDYKCTECDENCADGDTGLGARRPVDRRDSHSRKESTDGVERHFKERQPELVANGVNMSAEESPNERELDARILLCGDRQACEVDREQEPDGLGENQAATTQGPLQRGVLSEIRDCVSVTRRNARGALRCLRRLSVDVHRGR